MINISIRPRNGTLACTSTPSQSEPWNYRNEPLNIHRTTYMFSLPTYLPIYSSISTRLFSPSLT